MRAFADCDEFMFGPNLLVANVVEPGLRELRVYLPRGVEGWYDFHTGAYYQPGSEVVVAAPLDRIPMFARAGAMLPLTGRDDCPRLHDEPSRHLRVFPSRYGQYNHRALRRRRDQLALPRRRLRRGRLRHADDAHGGRPLGDSDRAI